MAIPNWPGVFHERSIRNGGIVSVDDLDFFVYSTTQLDELDRFLLAFLVPVEWRRGRCLVIRSRVDEIM